MKRARAPYEPTAAAWQRERPLRPGGRACAHHLSAGAGTIRRVLHAVQHRVRVWWALPGPPRRNTAAAGPRRWMVACHGGWQGRRRPWQDAVRLLAGGESGRPHARSPLLLLV
jgi:hypothetical protein